MSEDPGEITLMLRASRRGDDAVMNRLLPLVYDDLRRIARRTLYRVSPGVSLHPTEIVHEAYLKLIAGETASWDDRNHFFGIAATAMRHLLVDHARHKTRQKRGGGRRPVTFVEDQVPIWKDAERILAVHEALERLAVLDPSLARVVECRLFVGYSEEQTARALGLSLRTSQRHWRRAKAWLRELLEDDGG